ncbi:oligomeric complex COG6 [Auriscalpium vulgare]|uniref:Oligomeric complex COG6 n=1 Tax=Auriscalpium vulgare TaxID=40419 RepID=A0ACB8RMA3_9AGAM|nr:oligomeric complex COG6 [Auriscalpium vulgare]
MLSTSTSQSLPDIVRRSASPATVARNPVSLRLYKVLGATFDDDATKEALMTLSELYSSPIHVAPTVTELRKDGEEDAEPEPADGLGDVLSFLEGPPPGDTAAKARKHLRRDIEGKLAEGSQKFLKAFGEVDQKLEALQGHISVMRLQCDQAQSQLQSTNEACKSLLDRAESLREERQDVNRRQSIVTLFLARFTLSEDETQAITSPDTPIGSKFFAAMDKTEKIRDDCRVLMAGEGKSSQAGLDIMSSTSATLDRGYDKLFRYCVHEFRQMGRDSALEVGSTMREAVRRLRLRPALLAEALSTLSQTRQATIVASFLSALTNPATAGTRPIELHAHDALRYIGDMLAWVHQAIAAEHEFLEGLFGVADGGRMVGAVREFGSGKARSEEQEWMTELMDGAVKGLCAPLKNRVLQTVRAQENSIIAYNLANLLQFYTLTMMRTIGDQALLSTTLKDMTSASYQVFFDAIEAQGRALLRLALDPSDQSLTPPAALLTHAQALRSILALHTAEPSDAPEGEDAMTARVLDVMVDPAVEMCVTAAEEKEERERRRGRVWDRKVFVLNCLTYLVSVLEAYAFTGTKREMLDGVIEGRVQELTEEHFDDILKDTGLKDAIFALDTKPPSEPLALLPATQPPALQAALHTFSTWLSSLEAVHSPRLARLSLPALHARVHHAALRRLGRAYERLCAAVRRTENRYEAAATLLGGERPFGSVSVLWQIFGMEEEDGEQ